MVPRREQRDGNLYLDSHRSAPHPARGRDSRCRASPAGPSTRPARPPTRSTQVENAAHRASFLIRKRARKAARQTRDRAPTRAPAPPRVPIYNFSRSTPAPPRQYPAPEHSLATAEHRREPFVANRLPAPSHDPVANTSQTNLVADATALPIGLAVCVWRPVMSIAARICPQRHSQRPAPTQSNAPRKP